MNGKKEKKMFICGMRQWKIVAAAVVVYEYDAESFYALNVFFFIFVNFFSSSSFFFLFVNIVGDFFYPFSLSLSLFGSHIIFFYFLHLLLQFILHLLCVNYYSTMVTVCACEHIKPQTIKKRKRKRKIKK